MIGNLIIKILAKFNKMVFYNALMLEDNHL